MDFFVFFWLHFDLHCYQLYSVSSPRLIVNVTVNDTFWDLIHTSKTFPTIQPLDWAALAQKVSDWSQLSIQRNPFTAKN